MSESQHLPQIRYKSELLIFLSVDIVGSTAYKNTHKGKQVLEWLPVFKAFHENFPIKLRRILDQENHDYRPHGFNGKIGEVKLWKSLGDELIFYFKLSNSDEAVYLILCFIEAIQTYTTTLKKTKNELSLKGTAWIAGFPVKNAKIISSDNYIDFIGPSIDIGFRLSKLATERKFIVSCDLAWILAVKTSEINYYYDGKQGLKGVLNDQPYPVIWLQKRRKQTQNADIEDELYVKCDTNKLKAFCKAFIESSSYVILPFIEGDPLFKDRPPNYDDDYQKAIKILEDKAVLREDTLH